MEKNFVELPAFGGSVLVNISCIQFIEPAEEGGVNVWYRLDRPYSGNPRVFFHHQHFDVPYEEAKRLLGGSLF